VSVYRSRFCSAGFFFVSRGSVGSVPPSATFSFFLARFGWFGSATFFFFSRAAQLVRFRRFFSRGLFLSFSFRFSFSCFGFSFSWFGSAGFFLVSRGLFLSFPFFSRGSAVFFSCFFLVFSFSALYEVKIKKIQQSQVLNLKPLTKQDS
jgi:hypothetical protein